MIDVAEGKNVAADTQHRRIRLAIFGGGVASLAVSCVMIARDLLMARAFGVSGIVDGYIISYALITFAITVLAGSINSALIPAYSRLQQSEGAPAALALAWKAGFFVSAALGCIALVLALFSESLLFLVAPNLTNAEHSVANCALLWMVCMLPLQGLVATLSAIAHGRGHFVRPGLSPALSPMFAVLALAAYGQQHGVIALAAGTMVGGLVQLTLFPSEWKCLLQERSRKSVARRSWCDFTSEYRPVMTGALLISSMPVINQVMAATLAAGSIAALTYGQKLASLVVGIAAVSLGNALLPHFSEMVARRDWSGLKETASFYRRIIIVISTAVTLFLIAMSNTIVELAFYRGEFDESNVALVSRIQIAFILQIPFYLLNVVNVRLISALKRNTLLLYGTILSLLLKLFLNYFLMNAIGVIGIALATSIVYAASSMYLGICVRYALRRAAVGG